MMEAIKDDLKQVMPVESVLPSEIIVVPNTGEVRLGKCHGQLDCVLFLF